MNYQEVNRRGLRSAQPAAATVPEGTTYYVTDEFVTERRSAAAVWESISDTSAVADDSITYAKMQNISVVSKLLGRGSAAGAGDPQEITLGTGLAMSGTTLNASGSSSGLVLLEQHVASASATLDFTTAFTSTYDEYLIECVNLIPATNGVLPQIRFSTDGGATYDSGANYQWANSIQTPSGGTGFTAVASATGAAAIVPTGTGNVANTAAGGGLRFTARLYDPLSAAAHKALIGEGTFRNSGDSNHYRINFCGYYISTTAVNAMRVLYSSGNIASGVVRIYGIAKT